MPSDILPLILMPLQLEAVPLCMMGISFDWVLVAAQRIAEAPVDLVYVKSLAPFCLPLITVASYYRHCRFVDNNHLVRSDCLWPIFCELTGTTSRLDQRYWWLGWRAFSLPYLKIFK